MLRAAIVGASGYTGGELARLLCTHPTVTITAATSRQYDGQPLSAVFPHLRDRVDVTCRNLEPAAIIDQADLIFCAVPHKTAMDVVPSFLEAGKKVVDLSADFRIKDAAVYEQWYQPHSAADLVEEAVYGLPEIFREELRRARLVANPGPAAISPKGAHRLPGRRKTPRLRNRPRSLRSGEQPLPGRTIPRRVRTFPARRP